jgi:adenylate kinase
MLNKTNSNYPRPRVTIFLGAPGSGKGTQSSWLAEKQGIPCLSTGALLRAEAKKNTPSGVRMRRTLASGSLVSDELVCELVGEQLRAEASGRGLILDGFPRTVEQAVYLDSLLADLALPGPTVIYLQVSEAGLLRRLGARRHCAVCGSVYNLISRPSSRGPRCERDGGLLIERDDDREEIILRRLSEFEASSAPLVDYYQDADFHRVDGDQPLDQVASELLKLTAHESVHAEMCAAA